VLKSDNKDVDSSGWDVKPSRIVLLASCEHVFSFVFHASV